MGWPQWVILSFSLLNVAATLSLHGKPRGPFDAGTALIATVLNIWLLWMGGFFS